MDFSLIGIAVSIFVAGFGVLTYTASRLDKKVDKEAHKGEHTHIESDLKEIKEGNKSTQKLILDMLGMQSSISTKVDMIDKRLNRMRCKEDGQ